MCSIPLDLERKFEQRWAARFVSPVASATPKSIGMKVIANTLPRPAKANEKPAGERGAGMAIIDQTAA
jgi:hypothetical protein